MALEIKKVDRQALLKKQLKKGTLLLRKPVQFFQESIYMREINCVVDLRFED